MAWENARGGCILTTYVVFDIKKRSSECCSGLIAFGIAVAVSFAQQIVSIFSSRVHV